MLVADANLTVKSTVCSRDEAGPHRIRTAGRAHRSHPPAAMTPSRKHQEFGKSDVGYTASWPYFPLDDASGAPVEGRRELNRSGRMVERQSASCEATANLRDMHDPGTGRPARRPGRAGRQSRRPRPSNDFVGFAWRVFSAGPAPATSVQTLPHVEIGNGDHDRLPRSPARGPELAPHPHRAFIW